MTTPILCLLLAAAAAEPPPTPPPEPLSLVRTWGVVGALTAPRNVNVLEAGLGWPGVHVSYLRGLGNQLELGGRFSFNYGIEGQIGPAVQPGLKFQFLLRYKFFDNRKASLALRFEPGALFYFSPAGTLSCTTAPVVCGRATSIVPGLALPVGMRLGIVASSAINVGVSFDLAMWFRFAATSVFFVPVLTGVGVEYFLQSNLLLFYDIKMGPTLLSSGGTALFTFESKLGVGYRF